MISTTKILQRENLLYTNASGRLDKREGERLENPNQHHCLIRHSECPLIDLGRSSLNKFSVCWSKQSAKFFSYPPGEFCYRRNAAEESFLRSEYTNVASSSWRSTLRCLYTEGAGDALLLMEHHSLLIIILLSRARYRRFPKEKSLFLRVSQLHQLTYEVKAHMKKWKNFEISTLELKAKSLSFLGNGVVAVGFNMLNEREHIEYTHNLSLCPTGIGIMEVLLYCSWVEASLQGEKQMHSQGQSWIYLLRMLLRGNSLAMFEQGGTHHGSAEGASSSSLRSFQASRSILCSFEVGEGMKNTTKVNDYGRTYVCNSSETKLIVIEHKRVKVTQHQYCTLLHGQR